MNTKTLCPKPLSIVFTALPPLYKRLSSQPLTLKPCSTSNITTAINAATAPDPSYHLEER
ncbi:hypothetical protein REPUB_Repub15cG0063200 [Reevesia pubescens]